MPTSPTRGDDQRVPGSARQPTLQATKPWKPFKILLYGCRTPALEPGKRSHTNGHVHCPANTLNLLPPSPTVPPTEHAHAPASDQAMLKLYTGAATHAAATIQPPTRRASTAHARWSACQTAVGRAGPCGATGMPNPRISHEPGHSLLLGPAVDGGTAPLHHDVVQLLAVED